MTLFLVALPLTACGSSSNPVAKAAKNATKQDSVHVDIRGTVSAVGQKLTMNGNGDLQTKTHLAAIHFAIIAAGKRITMDSVQHGTRIFMRSPLFTPTLPSGKKWVVVDLKSSSARLGASLKQYAQQDPQDTLAALTKARSVKKVGTEVVQGVSTTHYRATIDLSKAQAAVPVDVWIDQQDLPVRVRTQDKGTTFEVDLSSYGEKVNVKVPPATETYDMTNLGG